MNARQMIIYMAIALAATSWRPGRAAELPPEFGRLLPVYAGAHPIETRYTRNSATVRFSTDAPFAQVAAFYDQALPERGWRALSLSPPGSEGADQRRFARDDMHLTLSPGSGRPASQTDFVIEIYYPGGRE